MTMFLIEKNLIEFSLMSITDYYGNIQHFPPIENNKRFYDNDFKTKWH